MNVRAGGRRAGGGTGRSRGREKVGWAGGRGGDLKGDGHDGAGMREAGRRRMGGWGGWRWNMGLGGGGAKEGDGLDGRGWSGGGG